VGERDRPGLIPAGPYREPAQATPVAPPRYTPITRRRERLLRWLRSVPVLLLAFAALALERPWLLGAAIAWGVGVVILSRLTARSLNARLKALAGTLARGSDPHVAQRGLEALVADARGYPGFHSVGLLFLGISRARGGDVDGALELLYVVHEGGWLERRAVWQAWLLPWMAQLHAARGELDLAEDWLEKARKTLPADKRDALVSAETLLALRRGRDADAVARIEAYVQTAAETDPVRHHFALLRAFARARSGNPLPDDEVRRVVADCLAAPGRALPLEKWWAELAVFVETHSPEPAPPLSS
jgi:hypothetical protein